jgi:hypothetical protein
VDDNGTVARLLSVIATSVAVVAFTAAPAGALCSPMDLRLDREVGPMVAFLPQRPLQPGDRERAQGLLHTMRAVVAPYHDLRRVVATVAVQPEIEMKRWEAAPAGTLIAVDRPASHDDEHRPRTLLYRRTATGFRLAGVQFSARNRRTDAQLDDILPTSIARWHQVVRHCTNPPGWSWIATVFPFERDDAAVWRTLELTRYVTVAPHRLKFSP